MATSEDQRQDTAPPEETPSSNTTIMEGPPSEPGAASTRSVAANAPCVQAVELSQQDPLPDLVSTLLNLTRASRSNVVIGTVMYWINPAAPALRGGTNDFGRFYEVCRTTSMSGNSPVMVLARMKLDSNGSVVVWRDWKWVDLADWVSIFKPYTDDPIGLGSHFWKTRYIWHQSGKPFYLLNLPRELRDMIYEACATFFYHFRRFPGPQWKNGWNCFPYRGPAGPCGMLESEHGINGTVMRTEYNVGGRILNGAVSPLRLLLSNKQVSREFKQRMWKSLEFRFTCFTDSWKIMNNEQCPGTVLPQWSAVSRISLELNVWEWLRMLSVPVRPAEPVTLPHKINPYPKLLQSLPLTHLTMFIRHQVGDLAKARYSGISWKACPLILVGYVLLYAKTTFSGIPNVQVTGCISPRMAAQFQQMHREARAGATQTLTEWDVIGPSTYLARRGRSWMQHGLYDLDPMDRENRHMCFYLDGGEDHDCYYKGECTDGHCILQHRQNDHSRTA